MFSPSKKLAGILVLFFLFLNFGSAAPIEKGKRPAGTSPSSSPGDPRFGDSSIKKSKLDENLPLPKTKGVIEYFIPDSSNDEVSYKDVHKMALKQFEIELRDHKPELIQSPFGNDRVNSLLIGVAYFKGVGFAVSSTPMGVRKNEVIQEIENDEDLLMIRTALKTSLRNPGPHVEDNLYKMLIKEAIKAKKLDPKATRFPDEAKVTVGIHGVLPHQWTIKYSNDKKTPTIVVLDPSIPISSPKLEQPPCQTGLKNPSCKAVADGLNVITFWGPPKARPVTPEKQTAGASSTAPAPAAAPVTPGTIAGPNQQSPAYSDVSEKDYTDSVKKTLGMQLNPKDPESPSKGAKKDGKKTGGKRSLYRSLMRLSI